MLVDGHWSTDWQPTDQDRDGAFCHWLTPDGRTGPRGFPAAAGRCPGNRLTEANIKLFATPIRWLPLVDIDQIKASKPTGIVPIGPTFHACEEFAR